MTIEFIIVVQRSFVSVRSFMARCTLIGLYRRVVLRTRNRKYKYLCTETNKNNLDVFSPSNGT
jgi:hypothetical protein